MPDTEDERKLNPNDYVPPVMALGTWLFAMWQAAHGIHFVPDQWMLTIILLPYGSTIYSIARDRLTGVLKRLPKKPD